MPWTITLSTGEVVRCKTFTAGTRSLGRPYLHLMDIRDAESPTGPVEMRYINDVNEATSFTTRWEPQQ